jgi:tetratricopeptide (TPR) repeat protein
MWSGLWKPVRRRPLKTTVLAVVLLAPLALGAIYLNDRARQINELWRQAEAAVAEYEFDGAQTHLAAMLAVQPDSAKAHFLLAQAYRRARREDFEQARTHLLAAQRLQWPDAAVASEYALLDFQQHGTRDAREKALHGLLDEPDVDRRLVFEALVRGCLRGQRLEHAGVWLQRWLAAFPDDWYAYLVRGTVWQHSERPERAAADYARVLRDKPASADVKHRLGLALVQGGSDYPRALQYLEEHRRHHPEDADTQVGIARCRCVLNDAAAGGPCWLQSALRVDPRHAPTHAALADYYRRQGDAARAAAHDKLAQP